MGECEEGKEEMKRGEMGREEERGGGKSERKRGRRERRNEEKG